MKSFCRYFLCICFIAVCFASCNEERVTIIPADLEDLSISTRPGEITLRWQAPDDTESIHYIKVTYYDPRLKKDVLKTLSVFSDTLNISETRQKHGEYVFTIRTVSPTGDESTPQQLKIVSEPAPVTTLTTSAEEILLTAESLYTEMQEPSEGPIANLVTNLDNAGSFFHTRWSSHIPGPHWFQVDLGEVFNTDHHYRFWYLNRNNANNKPVDFDLLGSMDPAAAHEDWFLIRNFTREADNLNVANGGQWSSESYPAHTPFRYIRFSVNATNTNSVFFTMSGFRFWKMQILVINPEDPNVDF